MGFKSLKANMDLSDLRMMDIIRKQILINYDIHWK